MRVGVVLAAVLAMASLALHLMLPFAIVDTGDDTGAQTLSRSEMAHRLQGDALGAVPGTSMAYLLAASVVTLLGGAALLAGLLPGAAGRWSLLGGAMATGLGAAMGLHGNALWAGRSIASWGNAMTGASSPAPAHTSWNAVASSDVFASIVVVSPIILVAIHISILALLAWAWPGALEARRGIRSMAHGHARVAVLGAAVLLLCALLPWVVQTLPSDGGEDHYVWSAYDILQKREAGIVVAGDTGEAGLIPWNGLGMLLQAAFVVGVLAIMSPWLGIAGRHLESMGQGVFGRLLENASLATIGVYAYLMAMGFLAAFPLADPTTFQKAVTTGVPMVVTAAGLAGLVVAGRMARRVLAVDNDVVADDFPEPVVYD